MTIFGVCEVCGREVTSSPAFPVEGWEVPRDQGGTNHIRSRRRVPNRVRHLHCLPDEPSQQERLDLGGSA